MGALVSVATTQSALDPVLTVRTGPQSGERFLIHPGRLTIGRDPGSDFCLNDVTVSRLHSVLSRDSGVVSIKDAGSANGTIVNGVLVDERVLGDGDVVQIGNSQLVYSESRKHRRPPIGGTQVTASAKARSNAAPPDSHACPERAGYRSGDRSLTWLPVSRSDALGV